MALLIFLRPRWSQWAIYIKQKPLFSKWSPLYIPVLTSDLPTCCFQPTSDKSPKHPQSTECPLKTSYILLHPCEWFHVKTLRITKLGDAPAVQNPQRYAGEQKWYSCGCYLLPFEPNPTSEVTGLLLEAHSAHSPHIQQQCLAGISLDCDLLQGPEELGVWTPTPCGVACAVEPAAGCSQENSGVRVSAAVAAAMLAHPGLHKRS